ERAYDFGCIFEWNEDAGGFFDALDEDALLGQPERVSGGEHKVVARRIHVHTREFGFHTRGRRAVVDRAQATQEISAWYLKDVVLRNLWDDREFLHIERFENGFRVLSGDRDVPIHKLDVYIPLFGQL